MKKTAAIIMALVMLLTSILVVNAQDPQEQVAIRAIFEEFGAVVHWNGADRTIHIDTGDGMIIFKTDVPMALVDGEVIYLQYGVTLVEGVSFISPDDLLAALAPLLPPEPALPFYATRLVTLTPQAREIALQDFDYLVEMALAVLPTVEMFSRIFPVTMEEAFAIYRQLIYDMVPMPSATEFFIGTRWAEEPTDPRYLAADYLYSLLTAFTIEIRGSWHLGPEPLSTVEHLFWAMAATVHRGVSESEIALLELLGLEMERSITASEVAAQLYYDILTMPSTMWFYDLDIGRFDLDVDILAAVGTFNLDNITTYIIEPDRIAYFHIASFMNNAILDGEILRPFFEEIQDYEHLIIDLRGNLGGMAGHFPTTVLTMLISEDVSFRFPEFFVASDIKAPWFEYPIPFAMADLYGIFPAAEFVREQNMTMFNEYDLAVLDYVIVWQADFSPAPTAIPFGGEVWLLVDDWSASASVVAAMVSANTGFATVVGEPTARVTGVIHSFASLPNTGILFRLDLGYTTDRYGRAIEEFGFIPQILNKPGMDALETVLAIINAEED